jgi:tetratricopeptide (TPR) repeat protein
MMTEVRTETTFLNFDLHLKASGNRYQAQILDETAGQIGVEFELPFSSLELEDFLLYISQSHWATSHLNSVLLEAIQDFGDQLFQAVFSSTLRSRLHRHLRTTHEQAAKLRLRLHLAEAPGLAQVPWEYLYHPRGKFFFTISPRTSLVRYQAVSEARPSLAVALPLKVLVVVSTPTDQPPIYANREWLKLRQTLNLLEQYGLIVLEHLVGATLDTLQQQLGRGKYHIIHFIGHADGDDQTGEGGVLLQDEDGLARSVSSQILGQLLSTEETLRLAFFYTSAYRSSPLKNPLTNLAQNLIQTGLPAVIAAPFKMTEAAATILTYAFYRALAEGNQADLALDRARRLILAQENSVEWGSPLLYACCPDGRLFNIEEVEGTKQIRKQIHKLYRQALAAYRQQDWGTVVEKLRAALGMDPTHPEAIFPLRHVLQDHLIPAGQKALQNPRLTEMRARFYATELDFDEKHRLNTLDTLLKEAQVAYVREAWSTAGEKLEACLKLDPTNVKLAGILKKVQQQAHLANLYREGKTASEAGDWHQALISLQKVQEIDSNYKEVNALLPDIERHIREQTVDAFYQEARAVLYVRGRAHYEAKRWSEALKYFRQIEQIDGSTPHLKRMIAYAEQQIASKKVAPTPGSIQANFSYDLLDAGLKLGIPLAIILAIILIGFLVYHLT